MKKSRLNNDDFNNSNGNGSSHEQEQFNNGMYVTSYEYARDGATNAEIARLLNINANRYDQWVRNDEHLKTALEKGRARQDKVKERFRQQMEVYFNCLKPANQEKWKELFAVGRPVNYSRSQKALSSILNDEQQLQYFYLGHYIASQGKHTIARNKTGVTKSRVERWAEDESFASLLNEIEEIRDEMVLEAWDNSNINKENAYTLGRTMTARFPHKGYADKQTLDINVKVEQRYLDPTDCLDVLCHNCQVNFLQKISDQDAENTKRKEQLALPKPKVIDAEFVERQPPQLP